jgi:hypothetical protein
MAGLFDPTYPSMLQGATQALDPNKPALLQSRGGVEAAQKALEAQRALEAARMAAAEKAALTNSARSFAPNSAAWTAAQSFDGWGAARGLAQQGSEALKVVGGAPATGLQALLYSGYADAAELSPAQREAKNPGEQADAAAYAQRVQGNAKAAAGITPSPPVSLMNPNADADSAEDIAAAQSALAQNDAPAVTPTPAGPAVQAAPANTEQARATTMQEQETQRQTLEQGALKGLSTGAVSRPKMAEAVVEADLARTGQKLTPEATKKAVTQELANMKSMDNNDLSRYISYALMAGGVLAVLLDKSGKAAEGFNTSFNKQLDRNLASGIQTQKALAAQAKLNQELAIQQEKFKRDDRGLDIREQTADQTGQYQQAQVKLGEGRLGLAQQSEGRQASQGAAGLGLRAQGLSLRQQALQQAQANADRNYELSKKGLDLRGEGNAIRAAGVAARANKAAPGVPLTEKGAIKVAKDFASSQGVDIDSDAVSAISSQIQQASKNDPRWATNPNSVMAEILNGTGYIVKDDAGIPFVPFTGGRRIKQKKQ